MLSGSIQGVMCGRIIEARHELADLAQKYVDQTVALLWKHLFINLGYLYVLLKHTSHRKWTLHELASVKTAYIDWYHQQLVLNVIYYCTILKKQYGINHVLLVRMIKDLKMLINWFNLICQLMLDTNVKINYNWWLEE